MVRKKKCEGERKRQTERSCSGTCMAAKVWGDGGVEMVFHTNKMNENSGVIKSRQETKKNKFRDVKQIYS